LFNVDYDRWSFRLIDQFVSETAHLSASWDALTSSQGVSSFRKVLHEVDDELLFKLQALSKLFPQEGMWNRYFSGPEKRHSHKTVEWAESRRCLVEVIHMLSRRGSQPSEVLVSLSHTQNASVAIATLKTSGIIGIGVDIESSSRKVSARALNAFASSSEQDMNLTPVQIWAIKEACFKANAFEPNTMVSQYSIVKFDPIENKGEVQFLKDSRAQFDFRIGVCSQWVSAFSVCRLT
jgi:phosphopantetheinyl transferase (holo-ACP synthase)